MMDAAWVAPVVFIWSLALLGEAANRGSGNNSRWPTVALVLSTLIAAPLVFAAYAHADPRSPHNAYWPVVCATLDADSSDWSIVNLAQYMRDDGLSGREAAYVIVDAVQHQCPQHLNTLRSFAKRNRTPHGSVIA